MGLVRRVFEVHGQLCASHPWEVIIATVTVIVSMTSLSLFAVANNFCGLNLPCEPTSQLTEIKSSDVIILTITRCIAVIYFYLQFRSLRKLGSKYLLGIAGLFTVFSSFVFSIGVVNLFGTDLTGLNEALPFFLMLVDLTKACSLAKFALSAHSQEDVVINIGRGMAVLGPMLTLDALVETLVIGVGTLSGVKVLLTMCCFGCLSVITNYLAFMTFYPACLALILELSRGSRPVLQIQQLAKSWQLVDEDDKPNPITQRVKIMMSAGLVFVHAHSRISTVSDEPAAIELNELTSTPSSPELSDAVTADISFWQFCLEQLTTMRVDYIVTLLLVALLFIKYIVFDIDDDEILTEHTATLVVPVSPSLSAAASDIPAGPAAELVDGEEQRRVNVSVGDDQMDLGLEKPVDDNMSTNSTITDLMVSVETQTEEQLPTRNKSVAFFVGELGEDSDSEVDMIAAETQTEDITAVHWHTEPCPPRSLQQCVAVLKSGDALSSLTDDEIILLVNAKHIATYELEKLLDNHLRGVAIRRKLLAKSLSDTISIDQLPYTDYDYSYVYGSCCENVVGYIPVPVGIVGPLRLDGKMYTIPMATTEGCLLASTNRGCRALTMSGNVVSVVSKDGMSRAPVVRFDRAFRANEMKLWLEDEDNYRLVMDAFDSTSRFARVINLHVKQVARSLHLRFTAFTGDAMGMNMVSKGCEEALKILKEHFPDMEILSLSGNFCTDKKSSAVNWIEGRGKSVVCDAVIPGQVIREVLKTSAAAVVELNVEKNMMGSAVAGSIGGFNAHASNVVTAIYIATGQDAAQNVCSSNCMTVMETAGPSAEDLYISCTMPCIEVGTVGGGTVLPPQSSCLKMLGVSGSNAQDPGVNAQTLARVVCATVMAAELSLMSALTTGDLVRSHLKHNRSILNMAPSSSEKKL